VWLLLLFHLCLFRRTEIKYVLEILVTPLTELMHATVTSVAICIDLLWSRLYPFVIALVGGTEVHPGVDGDRGGASKLWLFQGVHVTTRLALAAFQREFYILVSVIKSKAKVDNYEGDLFGMAGCRLTGQHASNPAALKTLYGSLTNIAQIFYSMNFQDLPAQFEDNMQVWFGHFFTLLSLPSNPSIESDDEDQFVTPFFIFHLHFSRLFSVVLRPLSATQHHDLVRPLTM
jgi:hypothetical protein